MARALVGYIGGTPSHSLDLELMRLRRRVAELQAEVAELRAERRHLDVALDAELHRIAEDANTVLT